MINLLLKQALHASSSPIIDFDFHTSVKCKNYSKVSSTYRIDILQFCYKYKSVKSNQKLIFKVGFKRTFKF